MRRYLALAVAALVVLVGCTSGDDDAASPSDDTVAERDTPTGPSPGVTDDTIKVGITYLDFEPIKDLTSVRHGDYEGAYRALIDDLNGRGGIHGRTIEPVFAGVSPIGTDSADAACVKLTEDEDVFVVLGFFQADTVLCVAETHQTALIGGTMNDERIERAKAPWFTTEYGGDADQDAIRALAEAGDFDGALAVVATTQGEPALRSQAEPLLEDLGIEPIETAVIDAPENDAAAQNAAVQTIAERFRASGVEKVLVYGQAGLTWANGAADLDYRPQLLFTNTAVLAYSDDPSKDVALLDGAVLGGHWLGETDSFDPWLENCFAMIEAATGEELLTVDEALAQGVPNNFVAATVACNNVALLEAILEAAGEDLNYGTFRQAGEGLGDIQLLPGGPTYHFGPPPSTDGDGPIYVFGWDAAERRFLLRDEP